MDRDMTDFEIDLAVDFDFDDSEARRVQRYVRDVVAGLGLRGDSSFVETEPHAAAYVALDGRLHDFPDHDVALLWNERIGWSAAVEDRLGELVEVARMHGDPRPAPAEVVRWVVSLFRTERTPKRTAGRTPERTNRDFAAFVPTPRAHDFS